MEFVTISNWDVPHASDDMMTEARDKFMPAILATGADNVYMVKTSDTTVSVVTHFPTEEVGKAAAQGISAVREKAAEHFGMTMVSVNTGVAYSS